MEQYKGYRKIHEIGVGENNPRNSEGDFIRLKDGRIMFVYSRYTGKTWDDGAACDLAAIYSSDNGETWTSEPRILIRAAEYGEKNIMSVTLMRMQNGELGMFYILKRNVEGNSICYLARSNDEGETFYSREPIIGEKRYGYPVLNNCRVLRCQSGRIIVPVAYHMLLKVDETMALPDGATDWGGTEYESDPVSRIYCYYSDDDGKTWKESENSLGININGLRRGRHTLQEPGVIEIKPGVIYLYMRSYSGFQYESFSVDNGVTWTEVQMSQFTSPPSPMKIVKNPNKEEYYSVYNPVPIYNGRFAGKAKADYGWGRTPLVIAKSSDGIRYGTPEIIEHDETEEHGYCYPALFFCDDDTMLISYCSGGKEEGACLCKTTIGKITV